MQVSNNSNEQASVESQAIALNEIAEEANEGTSAVPVLAESSK